MDSRTSVIELNKMAEGGERKSPHLYKTNEDV